MSNKWQSVSEVAIEFGIDQKKEDVIHVLDILREKRSKIHPDKNGGDFSSDENKETYHQLNNAIIYLEETIESSNQLVPLSQLPSIINSITSNMARHTNASSLDAHKKLKHELESELGRRSLSSKVVVGLVILVSLILFLQSGNLSNHLFLAKYSNSIYFLSGITSVLIVSILFFFLILKKENKERKLISYFMNDEALQYIFYKIKHVKNDSNSISMRKIKDSLIDGEGKSFGFSGTKIRNALDTLDDDVIDRIVDLQLTKLMARKVLIELDEPSAERLFKLLK